MAQNHAQCTVTQFWSATLGAGGPDILVFQLFGFNSELQGLAILNRARSN